MISKRLRGLGVTLGLVLASSGCVDDYGYGGLEVGYGAGGYGGDPYYDGYGYDGYGYGNGGYGNGGYGTGGFGYGGYGPSYFGWYNNFYYPGTGSYVYDRYRRPFRWNGAQQRYWSGQQRYRGQGWDGRGNWNGFDRRGDGRNDDGRRWQGNPNGVTPGQGYRGNRQWQGNPNGVTPGQGYRGNRQWQGNPNGATPGQSGRGSRGWQGDRQGLTPRVQGATPGMRSDAAPAPRSFTPPAQRNFDRGAGARASARSVGEAGRIQEP